MPPKKKDGAPKPPPLIGRVGTSLKVGIVGIPNVGKSTFFNLLTKTQMAAAENFPFCTIDPNENNRIPVPDERFDFLCEKFNPPSKVPAWLSVVDIAGLVKGAAEGQGLGNAFLSHIKACDAIFHMTRAFTDEDVIHVDGEVNPINDLETIKNELILKDIETVNKQIESLQKNASRSAADKKKKPELDCLEKVRNLLVDEKRPVRFATWTAAEIEVLNKHLFITAKPIVYLVNLSEKHYIKKKNKWLAPIKEWVDANDPGAPIIPFSCILEQKLIDMSPDEAKEYLTKEGTTSAMDKIIKIGYRTLQLEYFFTVGEDEVKCWTVQKGTKAPQAAGRIHSDMERGFIMAEVMKYDDFKEHGSELAVKAAGKYHQKGREYIVVDGDILLIKFNAGAGLSEKKKK